MLVIAGADPRLVKAAEIARAQAIPVTFLTTILVDLRRGGLVNSLRGSNGGYGLARLISPRQG
jgi:Rrf2 family protein